MTNVTETYMYMQILNHARPTLALRSMSWSLSPGHVFAYGHMLYPGVCPGVHPWACQRVFEYVPSSARGAQGNLRLHRVARTRNMHSPHDAVRLRLNAITHTM